MCTTRRDTGLCIRVEQPIGVLVQFHSRLTVRRRPTLPTRLSLPPMKGTPTWIRATAGPLTVSNTGWSGSFASFEVVSTRITVLTRSEPRRDTPTAGGVSGFDIRRDRIPGSGAFSGSSHPTGCSASAAWGPGEFHYSNAYVATTSPTQGTVNGDPVFGGAPRSVTQDDRRRTRRRPAVGGLVPPALVPRSSPPSSRDTATSGSLPPVWRASPDPRPRRPARATTPRSAQAGAWRRPLPS